ncbi:MAG TPA: ribonuclease J [Fimbriimonadaceae bacterium]|nr:ribonuclease J [Fimbriimonadaceae bacterium]
MSQVQVVALGGVGEIGKNCTVVQQDDDIVVIDCGLSFPTEEMLGIDIVVPDFTYLVENKDKVRGVFITHAHEDHVGGLPYLLSQINVPVYASELTTALITGKLEEKIPTKQLDIRTFKPGDVIEAGKLTVETIRITHSIPETCCMAIGTKHGYIFFTADFKFDFTPVDHKLTNITRIGEIGQEGVLCLLSDSTNVDRPGWGPSERLVADGLRKVFATAPGRVLLTTFGSNIHRMQQFCEVAGETGRKVAVVGRRMEQNLDICQRLGYIKIPKGVKINLDEMPQYADSQIAVLTTGSQGEPMSALVQMSKGTYGRLQVRQGDTLIYSARPIPGNEGAIWRTINRLFRQGCNVVYQSVDHIHVSGHAYQEELKMMVNLTRPYYIAPVHGEPRHQHLYNHIARGMGYPDHRIFTMEAGVPLIFTDTEAHLGEPVPCGRVLVDNSGTPGVPDEVLRDRYNVANDGLIVITIAIDPERGELVGDPILQAKGFHGPEGLIDQAFNVLVDAIDALSKEELRDTSRVRHEAQDAVRRFIHKRCSLRPLVLPTVVEV